MSVSNSPAASRGSCWIRWEPHVHAPGTILNDQFKDDWESYLTKLEQASPPIAAIGITDYYDVDCYRAVSGAKSNGRLETCQLIFPNVEMRLDVATGAGAWVNVHLLVNPEEEEHLSELSRFLGRLTFQAHGDTFSCSPEDLARLGRKSDPTITDDRTARREGAQQFKVSFNQLRQEYRNSEWAKANVLIAVAGGTGDGTSGVRQGSDRTLREEVESFSHIIFASSPAQRDFWLGRKSLTADQITERYGSLKPCLHGSDGHSVEKSGSPEADRYSWIKGGPNFGSLQQACIDPAGRAFVGETPPPGATPSEVIESVEVKNAPWFKTSIIPLNPGLVAIIGARGSGKTALADMIAAGCDAYSPSPKSFIARAEEHLGGARVKVSWQTGEVDEYPLENVVERSADAYPRARYLSQQFVEELCSADGITDELLAEVERVVFEAHPLSERDGAIDFGDLRDLRSARHRQARERQEQSLATLSERISSEIEKTKLLANYKTQVKEKQQLISRLSDDRTKLISKGSQERVKRLQALTEAAETVRGNVRYFKNREQQLLLVQDEVANVRTHQAPEGLRAMQQRYTASGIEGNDWQNFLLQFAGDVDQVVQQNIESAQKSTASWRGGEVSKTTDASLALIADDADLKRQPLSLLEAEIERIQSLISVDRDTAQRFAAISSRITAETEALARLREKEEDAEGAQARLANLLTERESSYVAVFEAVLAEQQVLAELYAPIRKRLEQSSGTLGKLAFSVTRTADLDSWAQRGEALLDLRKQGPFRGRGALKDAAEASLKSAWETGTAADVASAMKAFRDQHQSALLTHSPVPRTEQAEYRAWSRRFAQWLYGTDHISVRYSVDYDGIDIRKLSPGTRGIVLLLLYLALDDRDERPLIIDQPEENLDPQSIFDELVGLFQAAKSKRQVIMVTHNANLVINADADQILVARVSPHPIRALPPFNYASGGLEDREIRELACGVLEGGERAFKERARRLRIRLER